MNYSDENPTASNHQQMNVVKPQKTKHARGKKNERDQSPISNPSVQQSLHIDSKQCVGFSQVRRMSGSSTGSSVDLSDISSTKLKDLTAIDPLDIRVPLVGFEMMEKRSKFTVFKLHVHKGANENWFVFRRYTDFVQLQFKLKKLFPMFHLPLPPKRWFQDNYEKDFLDDRMHGLQAFIDSILCHIDLCNCVPVQEFFCFCEPPGPHDSIEESRAYCDELEGTLYNLKKDMHDKDVQIDLLCEELSLYKSQVELLSKALREANANGTRPISDIPTFIVSSPLDECDVIAHEADQLKPTIQEHTNSQSKSSTLGYKSGDVKQKQKQVAKTESGSKLTSGKKKKEISTRK